MEYIYSEIDILSIINELKMACLDVDKSGNGSFYQLAEDLQKSKASKKNYELTAHYPFGI